MVECGAIRRIMWYRPRMEKGDLFRSSVRDLSLKGLGVVDGPDGRVFFVEGAWPGDQGEFEVLSVKKTYGFAQWKDRAESSPSRQEAPCKLHGFEEGQCGACPWMMISYSEQVKQKQKFVKTALERAELLASSDDLAEIIPSSRELGFRGKTQFKTDGKRLGYLSRGTHHLVDVEICPILTDRCNEQLTELRERLPEIKWKPKPPAKWSSLDVDDQRSLDQVGLGRKSPFRQSHTEINQKMKEHLKDALQKVPHLENQTVVELFCGAGNLTSTLVECGFQEVLALDLPSRTLNALPRRLGDKVSICGMDLFQGNTWQKLPKKESRVTEAKVLVLDPPRAGLKEKKGFFEAFASLESIFYISCDIDSFVRDAVRFREQGWQLDHVQPFDQFPHTPHVELIAEFSRK